MDYRNRYYYFVNFDGKKQNQQVSLLKNIFSVKIRYGKFQKVYALVGVSKTKQKMVESLLSEFKETSSTTYVNVLNL